MFGFKTRSMSLATSKCCFDIRLQGVFKFARDEVYLVVLCFMHVPQVPSLSSLLGVGPVVLAACPGEGCCFRIFRQSTCGFDRISYPMITEYSFKPPFRHRQGASGLGSLFYVLLMTHDGRVMTPNDPRCAPEPPTRKTRSTL